MQHSLHSKRVITPTGIQAATILIANGKIVAILTGKHDREDYPLLELDDCVIMPGLIDPHVHINEPGRTHWEGFETATKAAAAGGITSLVDMPLNSSPVSTTKPNFEKKLAASKGKLHVNCGFWGGIVPNNLADIEDLIQAGVLGFKVFLTHSGIDEFPNVGQKELDIAMPILAKHGLPLLVHAELDAPHEQAHLLSKNPTSYQAYLASRPVEWETNAIKMMIALCEKHQCRTHIVHVSSGDGMALISEAKNNNPALVNLLSGETCPQYLYYCAKEIPDADTSYKCAPPIREKHHQQQLWQGLKNGQLAFIASDHSPAPKEVKELESGNLQKAWGGIAGLQFTLPLIWTKAQQLNLNFDLLDLTRLLSSNAAAFMGYENTKGKIAPGYDADLCIWHPETPFTLTEDLIQHRHKITPYLNQQLYGRVIQTYVGGVKVYDFLSHIALGTSLFNAAGLGGVLFEGKG